MRFPRTATALIAGITVLVSGFVIITNTLDQAAYLLGFVPGRLTGQVSLTYEIPVVLTPLTATLVHGGFLHLLFNLVVLLFCGTLVERALGAGGIATLYIVGAFAAAAAHFLADSSPLVPMVGASGAISALMGAYALMFGRVRNVTGSASLNRSIHVIWLAIAWVVIQWMTGFLAGQQGVQIAVAAHIGGFIAGLLLQRPLLLWRFRRA